jgi:hypothetical protein
MLSRNAYSNQRELRRSYSERNRFTFTRAHYIAICLPKHSGRELPRAPPLNGPYFVLQCAERRGVLVRRCERKRGWDFAFLDSGDKKCL